MALWVSIMLCSFKGHSVPFTTIKVVKQNGEGERKMVTVKYEDQLISNVGEGGLLNHTQCSTGMQCSPSSNLKIRTSKNILN